MSLDELENTTERVALVCYALFRHDAKLTTADVACMVDITPRGAYEMLIKISCVAPIYQDDKGRWMVTEF